MIEHTLGKNSVSEDTCYMGVTSTRLFIVIVLMVLFTRNLFRGSSININILKGVANWWYVNTQVLLPDLERK